MKKLLVLFTFCMLLLSISASAQTREPKISVTSSGHVTVEAGPFIEAGANLKHDFGDGKLVDVIEIKGDFNKWKEVKYLVYKGDTVNIANSVYEGEIGSLKKAPILSIRFTEENAHFPTDLLSREITPGIKVVDNGLKGENQGWNFQPTLE